MVGIFAQAINNKIKKVLGIMYHRLTNKATIKDKKKVLHPAQNNFFHNQSFWGKYLGISA